MNELQNLKDSVYHLRLCNETLLDELEKSKVRHMSFLEKEALRNENNALKQDVSILVSSLEKERGTRMFYENLLEKVLSTD